VLLLDPQWPLRLSEPVWWGPVHDRTRRVRDRPPDHLRLKEKAWNGERAVRLGVGSIVLGDRGDRLLDVPVEAHDATVPEEPGGDGSISMYPSPVPARSSSAGMDVMLMMLWAAEWVLNR
jgi:hypothetical protein